MVFSKRTGWEPEDDPWAEALRLRRESEAANGTSFHEGSGPKDDQDHRLGLIDLTISNPTACGLGPAGPDVLLPLAAPGALRYRPEPLGMLPAREAVARYYADAEAAVPPARICLTASTSEAYSFLLRLLCDPGDEVLIARPSYPLFDLLARLDDVVLREYPLFYDPGASGQQPGAAGGWSLDLHALEAAITPRSRAVIVVHPNNPTGNFVNAQERIALQSLCARHNLALIADEVFLDYVLPASAAQAGLAQSFAAGDGACLCFVLSGLSKICAMPQAKLSWIAACGPAAVVREAMERLEVIADTFLSVSGPTQWAFPHWLAARAGTQKAIRERMVENLAMLDRRLRGSLADRLQLQGGWTAVLRVPSFVAGEEFALAALRCGVAVQPGHVYGLPPGRCVLSLLTPPPLWTRGLARLPIDPAG